MTVRVKAALLVVLLWILCGSICVAQQNAKNVLFVFSSLDQQRRDLDSFERALRAHVPQHLTFNTSYVDYERMRDVAYQDSLAETFHRAYKDVKFDIVIASSIEALQFVTHYRDKIAPGVPIVFYALSAKELEGEQIPAGVTGRTSDIGLRETIDLALHLHPDAQAVAVVANERGLWWGVAQSELYRYRDRVKEVDLTGPPGDEILDEIAALPSHTVILFQLATLSAKESDIKAHDVLAAAARHAPTYCAWKASFILGCIGGAYVDWDKYIESTAVTAARVLSGERPENIPIADDSNFQTEVDSRELERWHIPESALPPGSVVLFREPTLWESYKWYIIGVTCLIILQAALIVGLLWQRAHRRRIESELALASDRLRLAVESARSVGWDSDVQTGENRWFGDLQTLFGLSGDTHDGSVGDIRKRVYPSDREKLEAAVMNAREMREPYSVECRVVRTDGEVRWIAARGKYYYFPNGEPERMLGIATDITELKLAEEALNNLSGRLIQAQEEERGRIARELHDDFQQRIAVLVIGLENLADDLGHDEAVASARLRDLWTLVGELGSDLHTLSHQLHSSTLETLGLVPALAALCDEFTDHHEIAVSFTKKDVPGKLPPEVPLCLFRIAQEALQNVRKHSRANKAEVLLESVEGNVHLSVFDPGMGFDSGNCARHNGIGIQSMEERLRLVNGRFAIYSRPLEGTRIDAWVPL